MAIGDEARRTGAEARAGARGDRAAIEPDLTPALPDRLVAARERKGVDLFRAERDTKIRARYLAALERGDYRELPGAVYTKGFLRNYAIYLELDPEDVLRQWRRERGDQVPTEPVVVAPKAILETPRPLTFSPSVIVAALMTIVVIGFGIYLAGQLMRFAKPPTLEVVRPASAVVEAPETATSYRLEGTATPGATVTVSLGPSQPPTYRVTALSDGTWSVSVDVRRGTNQFYIDALDPETGKHADEVRQLIINVPYLVIQAPTLTVTQPQDGTTYENGAIPVEGMTTNASKVVVRATWLGPPDGSTPPTPAPTLTPSPDPSASAPPAEPDGVTVEVADDGSFTTPLELTEGRWSITITATSPEGKTASLTRTVTVAYKGVNLVVTIQGGNAWLKVWVDGVVDPRLTQAGKTFRSGETIVFTGVTSVEVRTGSSGVTRFTLNGVALGALGKAGVPETWLFQPPAAPQRTQRR
ncbi:MAG: helix-turn-helix domain-containing protein [Chloroflexi bacterium]|nr:helix-turn-helix domain-containing protein [Chloroflexota bacterium]